MIFIAFFALKILPLLRDSVIIYSGGGDCHVNPDWSTKLILNSKKVIHWFSENLLVSLGSKMSGFPIGLCQRDLLRNTEGNLLNMGVHSNHSSEWIAWDLREDMVLPCGFDHTEGKGNRRELFHMIQQSCTICARCTHSSGRYKGHEYLKAVGLYKYVVSPMGMGADCYRTFEILSMGSVPVIPYYIGAEDFVKAGLPVLVFKHPSELTQETLNKFSSSWGSLMMNATEYKRRLSHDYWKHLLTEKLNDRSHDIDIRVNCTHDRYCTK